MTKFQLAPCHRPPSSIVAISRQAEPPEAVPRAAQRDVEIVAQPARQADMPAPPEILQRCGAIGLVEIVRESIAEQGRDADRHVAIGREVAIDLDRIAISRGEQVEAAMRAGIEEDAVDQAGGELGGDHRFLEQAPDDQQQRPSPPCRESISGTRWNWGMRCEARTIGPATRCGKKLISRVMSSRRRRRGLPPVDVDDVAHALEGEEGDADRQHHLHDRQIALPAEQWSRRLDLHHEEAVIFEEAEDREVGARRRAASKPCAAAASRRRRRSAAPPPS